MRLHPIVHVAARQPQLLAEHARAYGVLLVEEARHACRLVMLHAALYVSAGVTGILGVLFAGASLLAYAGGSGEPRCAWLLVAVPALPLTISALCLTVARVLPLDLDTATIGNQFKEDLAMLHETKLS